MRLIAILMIVIYVPFVIVISFHSSDSLADIWLKM